jgi:hypothetical protein
VLYIFFIQNISQTKFCKFSERNSIIISSAVNAACTSIKLIFAQARGAPAVITVTRTVFIGTVFPGEGKHLVKIEA